MRMTKAIHFITPEDALYVVKHWTYNRKVNNKRFIAMGDGKIAAIDNTTGECFAEDFDTLEEAVKWLLEIE